MLGHRLPPVLALVVVTAIWSSTFAAVHEAIAVYPLFAFLERVGWMGWAGCAIMLAGILAAEPSAARALRRLARRPEVA